ncbi:GIY-YIG catalytic domain-containing endonuclease [Paramecium bursaria Chlorella virus MA1E]|nr:GIY-YIG catalytic domain-containing endonuclease [Paramecium bursaria Chlorella virus MA1E]
MFSLGKNLMSINKIQEKYKKYIKRGTGIIYGLLFPSGKYYVGQTYYFSHRMSCHRNIKKKFRKLFAAIRKYKWENVEVIVLETDIPIDELNKKEEYYVEKYNSFYNGYNSKPGGGAVRGMNHPSYGKKHSITTRKLMSIQRYGKFNPNYGKKMTEEQKEKIRKSVTGFKHTEEAKDKIRKAMTGRVVSQETRNKFSAIHKGKVVSQETRDKISAATIGRKKNTSSNPNKRKCSINGNVYPSIREASSILNIARGTLKYRLNNEKNTDYVYI